MKQDYYIMLSDGSTAVENADSPKKAVEICLQKRGITCTITKLNVGEPIPSRNNGLLVQVRGESYASMTNSYVLTNIRRKVNYSKNQLKKKTLEKLQGTYMYKFIEKYGSVDVIVNQIVNQVYLTLQRGTADMILDEVIIAAIKLLSNNINKVAIYITYESNKDVSKDIEENIKLNYPELSGLQEVDCKIDYLETQLVYHCYLKDLKDSEDIIRLTHHAEGIYNDIPLEHFHCSVRLLGKLYK